MHPVLEIVSDKRLLARHSCKEPRCKLRARGVSQAYNNNQRCRLRPSPTLFLDCANGASVAHTEAVSAKFSHASVRHTDASWQQRVTRPSQSPCFRHPVENDLLRHDFLPVARSCFTTTDTPTDSTPNPSTPPKPQPAPKNQPIPLPPTPYPTTTYKIQPPISVQ